MNDLIFLREELYTLKMEYGFPISIYRVTENDPNYETGVRADTRVVYDIDRAVVLPVKFETSVFYTPAFTKAARDFQYGGYQDQEIKRFLIDAEDLPIEFIILPKDSIVYDKAKYEIVWLEKLEADAGYQLVAKRLVGAPVNEIISVSVTDEIRILDSTGVTLNE